MDWFAALITNPYLIVGVGSWALAQVVKSIIDTAINRKFDPMRLLGDGGMPSAHSATVCSIAMMAALRIGTGSFEFALAAIFAVVVCRDAVGVRQETGKQSVLLVEITEMLEDLTKEELPEMRLKKFVGHTFPQVVTGVLLGVGNALLMNLILPL